jgi:hypothetical protein
MLLVKHNYIRYCWHIADVCRLITQHHTAGNQSTALRRGAAAVRCWPWRQPAQASQTDSTMRGGGRRTAAPARLAVVGWTIADVCCVAAACSDMCVLADV